MNAVVQSTRSNVNPPLASGFVITRLDQLPEHTQVMSRAGGELVPGAEGIAIIRRLQSVWMLTTQEQYGSTAMFSTRSRIEENGLQLEHIYVAESSVIETLHSEKKYQRLATTNDSNTASEFGSLVTEALRRGASDIHLYYTPQKGEFWIRVNRLMEHVRDLPPELALDMMQAGYNTLAERDSKGETAFDDRIPLSASIPWPPNAPVPDVRLRYQTLPVYPSGVDCVLRLIRMDDDLPTDFGQLGFTEDQTGLLNLMSMSSNGLVIVCGPTGSGKTTTLRALLTQSAIARPGTSTRTVENPPEHIIHGARQTAVTSSKDDDGDGYTQVISAILRADPDGIMMGEINDPSTARLAQSMAQSGHPVMTTIHTSDPFDIVTRLEGLGLDRDVIGAKGFITGLIHQELLPVLCAHCCLPFCEEDHPKLALRLKTVLRLDDDTQLPRLSVQGDGCEKCSHSGISGVTVAAHVVLPNDEIQKAFADGDIRLAREIWLDSKNRDQGRSALDHALIKMQEQLVSPQHIELIFGALSAGAAE